MQESSGQKPSYRSLFSNRSFSSLWAAQVISQSGDAIFDVALLALVYATTGSTALTALTQAAVLVPGVLAGPIAGVYADRLNRRDLMVASNVIQGVVTAVVSALYVLQALSFSFLILLVLLLYTAAQFYLAANGAIIPSIVSRENLGAANGLFTLSTSTNQLVSYSVGGVAVAALGVAVPITYDSLTFFFAAALLMLVLKSYGQVKAQEPVGPAPPTTGTSFRKNFREGLSYVRRDRLFLQLIVFGLVVNGFGGAIFALLLPYAVVSLSGSVTTFGFILSTFLLGTIVGSIIVGKVNFREYVGKLLFFGVILFGLLLGLAVFVTSIPVALGLFFVLGALIACVNIPISTLVQTKIPGELLGRATTVLRSLLAASQPIAAVLAGSTAALTSIGTVFIGSGITIAVATSLLYLIFGELRDAKY
ncbi:MAG: MFS transporter [Thaumarchaeota archaeon]|nr:MFS transporter [Nitrososphaerota archaeon]